MKSYEQNKSIIKRYKSPLTFYLLSIIIPWGLWFFAGHISHLEPQTSQVEWATGLLSFAGLLAPVIIAMSYILPDQELRKDLLGRIFNFRSMKGEYILIAFFLMLVSILAAQAVSVAFGYSISQFELRDGFTFTSALFPVCFLLMASPLFEELAWHTYGTDCLLSSFNLFTASVIFAIFWGVWHFPLSSVKNYYHSNLVESGLLYSLNFVLSLIPFVLIMNWLYYKTNRNILLPIVFHITAGYFNEIFATHPISKVIQTGLLLMLSVYLVINEKELFFRKIYK